MATTSAAAEAATAVPEYAFSSSNRRYNLGLKMIHFPRRVWVALSICCLASFQGCLDSVVYPGLPPTENVAAKAHDSTLSDLTLTGGGTLYPAFSKSILVYQDTVEDSVETVVATAKTLDTTNTIIYETYPPQNPIGGTMYSLTSGAITKIFVKVTNTNGNSLIYAVNIFKNSKAKGVPLAIPWQTGIIYGTLLDNRDGRSYRTVEVGSRTWMAENLNYAGTSDVLGVCYNLSADSCAQYGRLYTWADVMNGAASSATSPSGVQGICPTGWHVPSDLEWGTMRKFVDTGNTVAGAKLASLEGWTNNIGTDLYGFRALPGGCNGGNVRFSSGGYAGWWSATENPYDHPRAAQWYIEDKNSRLNRVLFSKEDASSVRCIKDGITVKKAHDSTLSSLTVSQNKWWIGSGYEFSWDAPISPIFSKSTLSYQDTVENNIRAVKVAATSLDPENLITYEGGVVSTAATTNFGEQELSIVEGSTSTMKVRVTNANGNSLTYTVNVFRKALLPTSQIPWQSGISYGSVKDASGQSYKTVQIGMQTWMAENFNYAGPYGATGVCYNNNPDSCSNFGRLYSWAEVMNGSSSSNTSPSRVQGICPTGWHVPSDSEWTTLLKFVDTANSTSGTKLKSLKGWGYSNPGFNGDGVDAYGFRALPSGSRYQFACYDAGHYGNWWSATENKAWFMRYSEYKVLGPMTLAIEHSVSLRCIKDGMQ